MELSANEIEDKLGGYDFNMPVLDYYKRLYQNCFVIFHPFYKTPFKEPLYHLSNDERDHNRVESISWAEILKKTGIKGADKLAYATTYEACDSNFRSRIQHEWKELDSFQKENEIFGPYMAEDRVPEDVILSFLQFLIIKGYGEIKVGGGEINIGTKTRILELDSHSIYNYAAIELEDVAFITTLDHKYCLKLPYHDLPFTWFLSKDDLKPVIEKLKYEGFFTVSNTKMYWFYNTVSSFANLLIPEFAN